MCTGVFKILYIKLQLINILASIFYKFFVCRREKIIIQQQSVSVLILYTVRKANFRDITWNVEENMIHELFRVVLRFPRYISCYIAENWFPLGLHFKFPCIFCEPTHVNCHLSGMEFLLDFLTKDESTFLYSTQYSYILCVELHMYWRIRAPNSSTRILYIPVIHIRCNQCALHSTLKIQYACPKFC